MCVFEAGRAPKCFGRLKNYDGRRRKRAKENAKKKGRKCRRKRQEYEELVVRKSLQSRFFACPSLYLYLTLCSSFLRSVSYFFLFFADLFCSVFNFAWSSILLSQSCLFSNSPLLIFFFVSLLLSYNSIISIALSLFLAFSPFFAIAHSFFSSSIALTLFLSVCISACLSVSHSIEFNSARNLCQH